MRKVGQAEQRRQHDTQQREITRDDQEEDASKDGASAGPSRPTTGRLVPAAALKSNQLRRTSKAWNYFTKEYQVDGSRGYCVKCILCERELAYCNSTSNLIKHLRFTHDVLTDDLECAGELDDQDSPSTVLDHKVGQAEQRRQHATQQREITRDDQEEDASKDGASAGPSRPTTGRLVPAAALKSNQLRRTSKAWNFFTKEYQVDGSRGYWVKCILCEKDVAYCNSTSNLIKHLRFKHGVLTDDLECAGELDDQDSPSTVLDHKAARWIAKRCLPFGIAETDSELRDWIRSISGGLYEGPQRETVMKYTTELGVQAGQQLAAEIKELTEEKLLICISGDVCGEDAVCMLIVMGHWVDRDFKLQSRLLFCEPLGSSVQVTGDDSVASAAKVGLSELGVGRYLRDAASGENVNTVASSIFRKKCDNGSDIKAAWGDLEGATCVDYGLQLCADAFLTHAGVKEVVRCMNGITAHFSRSALATQTLYNIQNDLGLPLSMPNTKASTRWLGQFPQAVWFVHNADAIRKYDDIFPDDCASNPDGTKYGDHAIDETGWKVIRQMTGVLWPVAQIVAELQGQKSVTVSLVLPFLGHLVAVLDSSQPVRYQDERGDTSVVDMEACELETCVASARDALREAIVKRFFVDVEDSDLEDVGIATFLDPRFKLLDFVFPEHHLFHVGKFRRRIRSAVRREWSKDWKLPGKKGEDEGPPLKKHATERLMTKATSGVHAILCGSLSSDCAGAGEVDAWDELEDYRDVPQETNKDVDPLAWWSKRRVQFPTLSKMARQFLAEPATRAACERVFDRARRMHDELKGSTELTLTRALMVSINSGED